jgi:hypothetical protein
VIVELEARRARLRHLNQRLAPAEDIADKDVFSVSPSVERFSPNAGAQKRSACWGIHGPVGVVFTGIVAQRAVRPAVDFLLRLLIALQPQIAEVSSPST